MIVIPQNGTCVASSFYYDLKKEKEKEKEMEIEGNGGTS